MDLSDSGCLPPVHAFVVCHNRAIESSSPARPKTPHVMHTENGLPLGSPLSSSNRAVGPLMVGIATPSKFSPTRRVDQSVMTGRFGKPAVDLRDIINYSLTKAETAIDQHTAGGLPSSPFSKLNKSVGSSHDTTSNYTYEYTASTKHTEIAETTVTPFDMEIKPLSKSAFNGGSSTFNANFGTKTYTGFKPFPSLQTFASLSTADENQNQGQIILSDDLSLAKFDTSFPEPRPFHDLFAFEDNFPSSAPTTASTTVVGPPTTAIPPMVATKPIKKVMRPPTSSSFVSSQQPHSRTSTHAYSPPPTLPPPAFWENSMNGKVSLPPISNLISSSSQVTASGTSPVIMRLRNRTDHKVKHTSLSQQSISAADTTPVSSSQDFRSDVTYPPKPKKRKGVPFSPSKFRKSHKRRVFVAARSKNGCWTCRIRKKKCTEEKPSCLQCTKLGLGCDGYGEEKPAFMADPRTQRQRLDDIKKQTSKNKKVGVRKKV